MARPKKEHSLRHHHQIMLRLTDAEFEVVTTNARAANLSLAEYARKQVMKKQIKIKYEIVADLPELKELIAAFGRIGNNLNQIAKYFNSGGVHSQETRKQIYQGISDIYEMKYEVLKITDNFSSSVITTISDTKEGIPHSNFKTHCQ